MKKSTRFFLAVIALALTSPVRAGDYTWTGVVPGGNWNNTNNWIGGPPSTFPNGPTDAVTFGAPAGTNQPNVNVGMQLATLTVTGTNNWTFSTASTITNNGGIFYGSAGGASFAPVLVGPGGVTVTTGALTNSSKVSLYTGDTWVKGGIFDVSVAAFAITNTGSAAGYCTNPVYVGDPATGANAELRVALGGNRGITVYGGTGMRTVRFMDLGSTPAYTGPQAIDHDTAYIGTQSGYWDILNGVISGTGAVVFAGGNIQIGCATNTYTGQTIVNAGMLQLSPTGGVLDTTGASYLGFPAVANREILLGDVTGTNDALINFNNGSGNLTNNRLLRVRAGSSGQAVVTTGNGGSVVFTQPITLEKTVTFGGGQNGNTHFTIFSNVQTAAGCTAGVVLACTGGAELLYTNGTVNPAHNGGTIITNRGQIRWSLPLVPGSTLTSSFGTGPITLAGSGASVFELQTWGSGVVVFTNSVVVTGLNAFLSSDPMSVSITNILSGGITLAGRLQIGSRENGGNGSATGTRYQGTLQIDQSQGGRRVINYSKQNTPTPIPGSTATSWTAPARPATVCNSGPRSIRYPSPAQAVPTPTAPSWRAMRSAWLACNPPARRWVPATSGFPKAGGSGCRMPPTSTRPVEPPWRCTAISRPWASWPWGRVSVRR